MESISPFKTLFFSALALAFFLILLSPTYIMDLGNDLTTIYSIFSILLCSLIIWIVPRSKESTLTLKFMLKQISKLTGFFLITTLVALIVSPIFLKPFIYDKNILIDKINFPTLLFLATCGGFRAFMDYLDSINKPQSQKEASLFALKSWFVLMFFLVLFLLYGPTQIAGIQIERTNQDTSNLCGLCESGQCNLSVYSFCLGLKTVLTKLAFFETLYLLVLLTSYVLGPLIEENFFTKA